MMKVDGETLKSSKSVDTEYLVWCIPNEHFQDLRFLFIIEVAILSRRNTTFQDMSSVEHTFVALKRRFFNYF